MLRPTISQIATKGESYYSVVIAVAKRAREISDELYENKQILEQKPVKTAVEEFAARKYYIVEDVAYHSETKEVYVVYRRLYDDNSLWIREKKMFLSEVDHEKYPEVKQKWRFELVEEFGGKS